MARAQRTTTTGNITRIKRAGTSSMGNPSYWITLDDGREFRTMANGGVGYEVANYAPRYGQPPTPVILTLTKAGRVVNITYADGSR